jgi:superfamily II DNA/RNA helicase
MKYMPMQRQTLLFSATLPPQILKIAEKYLKSPQRIEIGETNQVVAKIVQVEKHLSQDDKYQTLVNEMKIREGTVIIFVRSKFGTEKLAMRLRKSGFTADAIHGDLDQKKRARVLQGFRDKNHRILVATDIASRGLDIPHIEHVINFDLPQQPEDFIHRIGRTARAGAEGNALSFITPDDNEKWRAIQKLINPNAVLPPEKTSPGASPAKRRSRGGRNRRGGSSGGSQSPHASGRPTQQRQA